MDSRRLEKIKNLPNIQQKRSPQECKNYRGISVQQSILRKVFNKLMQNRKKQCVERALGEEQVGFRTSDEG